LICDERQFPVLWNYEERKTAPRLASVPWAFLAPHEPQARANHGQTLERLAARGGLGVSEMLDIVRGQRWSTNWNRTRSDVELETELRQLVDAWKAGK
jgi:hypothetical protein